MIGTVKTFLAMHKTITIVFVSMKIYLERNGIGTKTLAMPITTKIGLTVPFATQMVSEYSTI